MKIAIIDVLGLSYDGHTINWRGLGGSESAVIFISRELVKLGFEVTVFNDCEGEDVKPGKYDGVIYQPLGSLAHCDQQFDVIISSRSTEPFVPDQWPRLGCRHPPDWFQQLHKIAAHRVLWMHDTFCAGDQHLEKLVTSGLINELFVLSDWHMSYVLNCDHGARRNYEVLKPHTWITRNGVHTWLDHVDVAGKDPNQFVYNASVSKGMVPLLERIWPRIHQAIPQAKLKIIGGYYRFKQDQPPDEQEQTWHRLRQAHHQQQGVDFAGIIPQESIAHILASSSLTLYPCAFPETFGISSMESLVYNTPLVTCRFGAVEETALDMACYKIDYAIEPNSLFTDIVSHTQEDLFVDTVLRAHSNTYLLQQKQNYCNIVKPLTSWASVALQWKQHFYRLFDRMLSVQEFETAIQHSARWRQVFGRRTTNIEDNHVVSTQQQPLLIITPFWNAENYVSRCITSMATQQYHNYQVILIDDASTDRSAEVAQLTINSCPDHIKQRFQLWRNKERRGAVFNQYQALSWAKANLDPQTIVMLLDGDDWLVNRNDVFGLINQQISKSVQFSYGSCWSVADQIPLIAQAYPPKVRQTKSYRTHRFNWIIPYTHLRTFRLHLFDHSLETEWKNADGEWLTAGGDVATFYSLIERADPSAVITISDVIVNYNDSNPLNDYKVNAELQNITAHEVTKSHTVVPANEAHPQPSLSQPSLTKPHRILVAVPTAKYIESDTFKSIYDLQRPSNTELEFQCFYGYNIQQIRNLMASWMLRNQFDWMLNVDSDIIMPNHALTCLLDCQTDTAAISSGIYVQRKPHQKILEVYVPNPVTGGHQHMSMEEADPPRVAPVSAVGFGCCLVRRDVYERVGEPWHEYHNHVNFDKTVSEDVDFCVKATNLGYQVVAHTGLRLGHITSTILHV
jgi:glycosyltransferase involved in cell wall biosynthesis